MHQTTGSDADPPDNAELVRRALGGGADGQRAWNMLVDRNARAVWKVLWSMGLSPSDRDDAFQCTWIKAVEKLHTIQKPERFHIWMMTIARHEAIRVSSHSSRLVARDDLDGEVVEYPVDSTRLEQAERVELARIAIERLGSECRDLIRLLTVEELSYQDVEEVMGWKPGGTAIRRDRCLKRLRLSPEIARYLRSMTDTQTSQSHPDGGPT